MSDVPAAALAPAPVWDLPLRLFHWSLLAAVATAALTGFLLLPPWLNLHLIAGTIIIALLLWRLWQMGRCGVETGDPGCVDPDRPDRDADFLERVT